MKRIKTVTLVRAALFAALAAAGAFIAVPVGPVPVTLQVFMLATAALVLTPLEAVLALGVYLALGAAGVPVFAGGGAGLGVLFGPTGGFIFGFAAATPLASLFRVWLETFSAGRKKRPMPVRGEDAGGNRHRTRGWRVSRADAAALVLFLGITYAGGLAGFVLVTGYTVIDALAVAVAPFVVFDAIKCVASLVMARAIRAAGGRIR